MAGLCTLYLLVTFVLVSNAFILLPQETDPVVVECGRDGYQTEIYPGRYNAATLIRSYNFGTGQYRNYENCNVKVWTDETPFLLNIKFNAFNVEQESRCRYDSLCVNGVKFCGSWESGKNFSYVVPPNRSFSLQFSSDISVVGRGFEIALKVSQYRGQGVKNEVSGGSGSAESLLIYRESNLDTYVDRCQENNVNQPPPAPWYGSTSSWYNPYTTDNWNNQYSNDNWYNYYTTDNWYNYYTTDNWYNPYTTDNWYNYYTTDNWYNPYTTDNWYNYYTTDNWYNPYTTDNWNNQYSTDNWYNYYTTDNWYNPYTTDNWYNYYTTDNWYNPYTTDNWYNYYTTDNWYNPYTTDNWYNYYTTDNWYNPYTTDNWNNQYSTDNWYNYYTTDNWYNPYTTDNWYNYYTTDNWYNPSTPDSWYNPYTTDNWYNYYTTDNWYNPYTTDNWYNYYTTDNWYNPYTTDNWYNYYTTDNWYNPYTTDNWYNYYTTDNWYNPYTTDNWYNYYTTDNWYNPYTTDNWNNQYSTDNWYNYYTTDNWYNYYTTDNWYNPYTTDNWYNYYTTDNWYNPYTTDNWYNYYTTDNWYNYYATDNWYNPYTTDNWYNYYTTDNWYNPYTTDNWYNYYTTDNWYNPYTTDNWYNYYTTDNWYNPYTTDNWNNQYSTDNWYNYYTTDNWYNPYTTDNWYNYYTTENWYNPYTTDNWYNYYTTDNWYNYYTTDNWYNPYTTDNWYNYYTTDNWYNPYTTDNWYNYYTTDNWYNYYTTDNWYNPYTTDNWYNYYTTDNWYNPYTTDNWYNYYTTDNWYNYYTTDNWYNPYTTDNWYNYYTTDNWYNPYTTDNWYNYYTTDNWYNPYTTDNWYNYYMTDNWYNPYKTDNGYNRYTTDNWNNRYTTDNWYNRYSTDNWYNRYSTDNWYNRYSTDNWYNRYSTDNWYNRYSTDNWYNRYSSDNWYNGYTTDNWYNRYTTDNWYNRYSTDNWYNGYTTDNWYNRHMIDNGYTPYTSGLDHSNPPQAVSSTVYCGNTQHQVYVYNGGSYLVRSGREGSGNQYLNNDRCSVTFRTASTPQLFTVTYNSFDVELHSPCVYDYLCVNGVTFCGNWERGYSFSYLVPANKTFTLGFTADRTNTRSGFEVFVSTKDDYSNGSRLEATGGYGSHYSWITYQLSNPRDYYDRCNFEDYAYTTPDYNYTPDWSYQQTTDYNWGYQQTTNYSWGYQQSTDLGIGNNGEIYCGNFQQEVYVSNGSSYLVRSGRANGSDRYLDNDRCSVAFRTTSTPQLFTVTYNRFDVEPNLQCVYDSLCVNGVKLCGQWHLPYNFSYLVPAYKTFTLIFTADSSNTGSFEVLVSTQDDYSNGGRLEATGGFGSNVGSITYELSNPGNYYDRCAFQNYGYPTPDYNRTPDWSYQQTTDYNWGYQQSTDLGTGNNGVAYSIFQCGNNEFETYVNSNSNYLVRSGEGDNGTRYNNNDRCSVKFTTRSTPLMFTVRFNSFDLEGNKMCSFDSLCVNNVKFCGSWVAGYSYRYLVPAYKTFTLTFSSDDSVINSGFEVSVQIENVQPWLVLDEISGVGDILSGLIFSASNQSEYRDECTNEPLSSTSSDSYFTRLFFPTTSASTRQPARVIEADDSNSRPDFINEHFHVIQRIIASAQDRIGYAYDLLTALF